MSDSIDAIRARVNQFVEERDWAQFHSPKNLAMAMIVEAGEVVEHFQWMTEQESRNLDEATKEKVGQELSDTLVYLLRIAEVCGIDLLDAANKKIDLNAQKYPVEKCKGSNAKYTDYQKLISYHFCKRANMNSNINSPVTELLQARGIAYDVIEIPLSEDKKPVRSLEELLTAKGLDAKSVVRSVVFKADSGQYALLAVAGGGRADWALLRSHLNERKCRMAEYSEVSEATGYVVGAVPPIALPESVRVLVDKSVRDYETVVIGSGVLGFALILKGQDLLSLLANQDEGIFVKVE